MGSCRPFFAPSSKPESWPAYKPPPQNLRQNQTQNRREDAGATTDCKKAPAGGPRYEKLHVVEALAF
jgi:hypothetical protein